ncbi:hypothetical protein NBRC116188_09760 [Oceaniserpentilla sp. 4NH20-0058]
MDVSNTALASIERDATKLEEALDDSSCADTSDICSGKAVVPEILTVGVVPVVPPPDPVPEAESLSELLESKHAGKRAMDPITATKESVFIKTSIV